MNQDQIVQLLLDAARGVVRDRFGVRSETLWPSLEPGLRGAAGKLVGDAIEAAKRMAKPTAAILPAPVLPGEADAIEKLDQYRKETMDALDVVSEAFSDPVLKRRFQAEVRNYEYLGEREESRIANEWAQDPSSSRWVNSKRIPLSADNQERVRSLKKQGVESVKRALSKHEASMAELKRRRSDLVEAMRTVLRQAEEEKEKGSKIAYFGRASERYDPSPYVAQKMRAKSILQAASALENGRRNRAVEWLSEQIGPETQAFFLRMEQLTKPTSFQDGLVLRDVLEPSEVARKVTRWADSEAETLGILASRADVAWWTMREKIEDAQRFLRAVEEMGRVGIQIPSAAQYAVNAEKLKSAGDKLEKEKEEQEEQRRASLEKAEKEEKARIEARPDFAHPYVENFEKAARQAEKKIKAQEKRHDFFALRPLQSKRLGVFPTDEEIRSKWTQDDEDRIEKRAAKFFENLENAKRRGDPTLTTKAHSDGLYAYVYDGANHLARFVTNKQKEAIPNAFQNLLIGVGASSQRDILEVDGKSLSWLAQIALAADKDELRKRDLGIATEVGYEKVFAVDDKKRGFVIKQTLPARFRGDSAVAGESVEVYVPAEQVRDALVGYEGTAYLSLPSPQEFRKLSWRERQDLSDYLIIYREDGEAHLIGAKVVARVGQD